MSEANHTTAPWFLNDDTNEIVGGEKLFTGRGLTICQMKYPDWICPESGESYDDDLAFEANAHLIAAAPDMLVALKAYTSSIESIFFELMNEGDVLQEALKLANSAIAKAEGRAE